MLRDQLKGVAKLGLDGSKRLKNATRRYLYASSRRDATQKLLATGHASAAAIAKALNATTSPREGWDNPWRSQIEAIRKEFLASDAVLDSWDRPWIEQSEELQQRLDISSPADRVAGGMALSHAVRASKTEVECRLLYNLVRELRPAVVVELGTNVGISGLYLAAAIKEVGSGKLITLEGSQPKAEVAQGAFDRLGFQDHVQLVVGDFFDTAPPLLEEHGAAIDLAFIDGFHEGDATIGFHDAFRPAMNEGVLVYDDIRWSDGMLKAWREIQDRPDVRVAVDADAVGVCAVGPPAGEALRVEWK